MNPTRTALTKSPSKTSQNRFQNQGPVPSSAFTVDVDGDGTGSLGGAGGGGDEDDDNEDDLNAEENAKAETTPLQQRKCLGLNCAVWVLLLSFMISIMVIVGVFMLFFYVVNPPEPDSSYNVLLKPCNGTKGC